RPPSAAEPPIDRMLADGAPGESRFIASRLDEPAAVQVVRPPERGARRDPDHLTSRAILASDGRKQGAQLYAQRRLGAMFLERSFPGDPLYGDGAVLEPGAVPCCSPREVVHELELAHQLEIVTEAHVGDHGRCHDGGVLVIPPKPSVSE